MQQWHKDWLIIKKDGKMYLELQFLKAATILIWDNPHNYANIAIILIATVCVCVCVLTHAQIIFLANVRILLKILKN